MRGNTGINKIFLLGQIATEPIRNSGKVDEYHFTLITREVHDKQGDQVEHLEYHNVKLPVLLLPSDVRLCSGQAVHIEGKIHTESWTDEQGIKRYSTAIIALQFNLLDTGTQQP